MEIISNIRLNIVATEKKAYTFKRKGYLRNGRQIKATKIVKHKDVLLKQPFLSGNIELIVEADYRVGNIYGDENGIIYRCIAKKDGKCWLLNVSLKIGLNYKTPTDFTSCGAVYGEGGFEI